MPAHEKLRGSAPSAQVQPLGSARSCVIQEYNGMQHLARLGHRQIALEIEFAAKGRRVSLKDEHGAPATAVLFNLGAAKSLAARCNIEYEVALLRLPASGEFGHG